MCIRYSEREWATLNDKHLELTHIDAKGRLRMVDVSDKPATDREAHAEATVLLSPGTLQRITEQTLPKGNVFEAARLAGILAAKRTWELIPLCHPLQITGVEVDFFTEPEEHRIRIVGRARTHDRTGIEMEALVAVTHAALTIYDMCKAIDRGMQIEKVQLVYKSGGRSGTYQRTE